MNLEFSEVYEPLFLLKDCRELIKQYPNDEYIQQLNQVDTVILYGGRECFSGNQLIVTKNGCKMIKDILPNELVLTYNKVTNKKEYKKVTHTKKSIKKKLLRIKLKNGSIIECTEDHRFFHNGCWIEIKELLKSWKHL